MKIQFKNILPEPLKHRDHSGSIWNRDITFAPGSTVELLAPSGKGKTTFISILYGLRYDFTGEVFLGDRPANRLSLNEWSVIRQQEFSIVFQDLRLFNHLTGMENIQVKAELTGTVTPERIFEMAEILGIEETLHRKVNTLSWGERQRVAIIRALVQPFKWLLLDEPFSHLDHKNSSRVFELILSECRLRKAGIIITTLDENPLLKPDLKVSV